KDVAGENFADAIDRLADSVSAIANDFDFLQDSPRLSEENKRDLETLRSRQALKAEDDLGTLKSSLALLATMLFKHYGRQVAVLVDEYDVPLAKAQQMGYHKQMVTFYSSFMSFLKLRNWEHGNPIFKIVMTGCLRVAKNQIFTGANNFTPYTVLSRGTIFSKLFGFTPEETEAYLSAFGLSEYGKEVKAQYDGYLFDGDEIYNPWDVSKFVASAIEAREKAAQEGGEAEISTDNFWVGSESSGTLAIKSYLGTLADEETQKLQDVCDGKEVETDINDSMNYDSLSQHNAKDMWSLLLHTGYLTATKVISQKKCVVRIPNDEIRECFRDSIMESFNEALSSGGKGARLAKALFDGDGRTCEEIMGLMLRRYVSNRVRAARTPENFYEGFMSGLLASIGYRQDELGVEHEAGDGFSDIVIKDPDERRAAVLELKSSGADRSMVPDARRAVAQIEEKRYARELLENERLEHVWAVGIAFYGKICSVVMKDMREPAADKKGSGALTK
ncbi:MAG: AAA family ATPase, partial [Succinivibrio sp.]|nr:AAA family ATPase [Succinivibrio sp.]